MPELPELTILARQADEALAGKTVMAVDMVQPKCLNTPPVRMREFLLGRTITGARERGKWLFLRLEPGGHLLLNLGMGGDLLYHPSGAGGSGSELRGASGGAAAAQDEDARNRYQFRLDFTDGSSLTVRFWWFGYVHAVEAGALDDHKMTASLGPSPLDPDLSLERFREMVARRPRRGVKSLLMDQKCLAGIGNVCVQDILWEAALHPLRQLGTLDDREVEALWNSMRAVLSRGIEQGGSAYERDLYGRKGRWRVEDFAVGYREGRPCPRCGTTVEKIRTGPTSTFICPECQRL